MASIDTLGSTDRARIDYMAEVVATMAPDGLTVRELIRYLSASVDPADRPGGGWGQFARQRRHAFYRSAIMRYGY